MWYLCGLGSNIQPEANLPRAVAELALRYGTLWLSPVIRTRPVGMTTQHTFLNALAAFTCELPPELLKLNLNALEERLGRDRSHPLSRYADRPIDVDILEVSAQRNFTGAEIEESYYRALFWGDREQTGVSLSLEGQPLGEAPATIYRNQGPGHKVIIEQRQQLDHNTAKSPFPG